MGELLTPEEVGERLKIRPRTVYAWVRAGQLRAVKFGRLWRIAEADLEQFIEQAKEAPSTLQLAQERGYLECSSDDQLTLQAWREWCRDRNWVMILVHPARLKANIIVSGEPAHIRLKPDREAFIKGLPWPEGWELHDYVAVAVMLPISTARKLAGDLAQHFGQRQERKVAL